MRFLLLSATVIFSVAGTTSIVPEYLKEPINTIGQKFSRYLGNNDKNELIAVENLFDNSTDGGQRFFNTGIECTCFAPPSVKEHSVTEISNFPILQTMKDLKAVFIFIPNIHWNITKDKSGKFLVSTKWDLRLQTRNKQECLIQAVYNNAGGKFGDFPSGKIENLKMVCKLCSLEDYTTCPSDCS